MHLARYHFRCMPFGLMMSKDVFQMEIDQIVERGPSILCVHKDLCIYGYSEKENDTTPHLMQVANNSGLVFNSRKCQIKCPQMTLYSTICTKEGMKPKQKKIQGITEMPPSELQQLSHL